MNELQMKKIQWLSRARQAEQKMHSLRAAQNHDRYLIRELEDFEDCSGLYQHLEQLLEQQKKQMDALAALRDEIRSAVEAVPDMELQSLLTRKYLAYETNEQIAEAMHYDVRTIQRKHKKGLEQITLPAEGGHIRNNNFYEYNL